MLRTVGSARERESSVGASERFQKVSRERLRDVRRAGATAIAGTRTEPWVYRFEVEMLNGHNGDVPPQPVLPMVEEPEIDVVQAAAAPNESGDVTLGGSQIFI